MFERTQSIKTKLSILRTTLCLPISGFDRSNVLRTFNCRHINRLGMNPTVLYIDRNNSLYSDWQFNQVKVYI